MVEIEDVTKKVHSLEKLKNTVITNYLSDIDIDNELDIYDKVVRHFFNGDLDNYYDNKLFDNVSYESKIDILNNVRKYNTLCFYNKDINNWLDSVDSIPIEDYNLITYQIVDNFDFLLRLYLYGGEDSLRLLDDYSNSNFANKDLCAVEDVKRNFVTDEILFSTFKELSSNNSYYDVFTKNEKNALIRYAEGTMYFYDNDKIVINSPLALLLELYYRLNGETYDISNKNDISIIANLTGFFKNEDNFYNNVLDMFYDYQQLIVDKEINYSNSGLTTDITLSDLNSKWILTDTEILNKGIIK
ncbi:MAG: hypothetical protein IKH54_04115 [Bacilli bacterium]|nr:hypothetical protein [Bacilli bacterium]